MDLPGHPEKADAWGELSTSRTRRSLWGLAVALMLALPWGAVARADEPADVIVFWAEGCPYCHAELEFLEEIRPDYPNVTFALYEVSNNAANRALFEDMMQRLGEEIGGVPTTIIGDRVIVGFDERRAAAILDLVAAIEAEAPPPDTDGSVIDVPLIGEVDVASRSLLAATVLIAFVDGFNPCSLWVLSMLLALVINGGDRRRLLAVGVVFLAVTAAMYGVYIGGLYSVLSYVAFVDWIRFAVAVVAAVIGLLSVKEYFAFARGPSLTIAARHKPTIYQRMRFVASPDRSLLPALGGTALLAVGVSLVETPCTAGFPVLWANLLSDAAVGFGAAAALFGVYMVVFLADELLVLGAAVITMRVTKVTERHGRVLKLIGGTVMLALAGVMLTAPALMESVTGAVAVFVAAAATTALVIAVDKALHPRRAPARHKARHP